MLGDLLLSLCHNATRALLAAPYIKTDALAGVLAEFPLSVEITCVTRWNPHDIAAGASDTECRTMVLELGGSFWVHPMLHAKYYRIDDTVLIGSANLTNPAMGWANQPNLEILSPAGAEFDATAFENKLLQESREISDAEFLVWDSIPAIRAETGHPSLLFPQLDNWRPATRDPRHLVLSYQGHTEEIASLDERRLAHEDIAALVIPSGLSLAAMRKWTTACLLSAPFTSAVVRLPGTTSAASAARVLAESFDLSMSQARRDMEAVQNWLRFFAPEVFS